MTAVQSTRPGPSETDLAAQPLQIAVEHPRPDAIVIAVTGSVDGSTIRHLEDVLWPRLAAFTGTIAIDLTEVAPLEVPGLQLLTQAHMRTQARGVELRVVVASEHVREGLRAAGLEVLLDIRPTVAAALAADDQCVPV